jgi:hypothetical protein
MPDYRKGKDTTLLDMRKLKEQFEDAETYEDDDGNKLKTIYLGDIRDITPSGKVYTPFAHSNLNSCNKCKGEGSVKNEHGKKHNYTRALKKHNQIIKELNKYENWRDAQITLRNKFIKTSKQMNWFNEMETCTECYGLGSLEARLDQDFWEKLQSELDEISAWNHESEGDGCDVMVSIGVD